MSHDTFRLDPTYPFIATEIAPARASEVCSPESVLETDPSFPITKKVGVDCTPYSLNTVPEES